MKARDYEFDGELRREYYFGREDLVFTVEAYRYKVDEDFEHGYGYEPVGDTLHENYNSFEEAVRKCIELIDKGWEVVRMSVHGRSDEIDVWFKVDFSTGYTGYYVSLSLSKISKEFSEKLRR